MKGQVIDLVRNVISGKMSLIKNALLQENVTSHKFVHKVHKVWNKIHSSIYHDSIGSESETFFLVAFS